MKIRFRWFLTILLELTAHAGAKDFDEIDAIDPLHFLAGLGAQGAYLRSVDESACESFYKEGGEQRIAELFVQSARTWHQREKTPELLETFFQPGGKRLVVNDALLGAALRDFYADKSDEEEPNVR